MELTIIHPDSNDYCEATGITPERQQELSGLLDAMVRRLHTGPVYLGKMHDTWAEIASYCTNPAELIYCTTLHCGWHARRGKILAPGPLNYGVIALGIEQLWDRLRKEFSPDSLQIRRKLVATADEALLKEGARAGVQWLLDRNEVILAQDIMNKLTGFAF